MKKFKKSKYFFKGLVIVAAFGLLLAWPAFLEFEHFGLKRNISILSGGHGGDWLQFWGTYLGIIFSVILTLYVTNKQGEIDRSNAKVTHAIEIYIDTLTNALDITNELSDFIDRCERYIKRPSIYQSKTYPINYDIDMILLLKSYEKYEVLTKTKQLQNIIKKMPFEKKDKLKEPIAIMTLVTVELDNNDYLAMYEDKPEMNDISVEYLNEKFKQNVTFIENFVKNYKLINRVFIYELDSYNKI